jgi:hypothetical protein
MKRSVFLIVLALAFGLIAASAAAYAQATFKIPFKFQAGGKKLPAGEYWIAPKGDKQLVLCLESKGEEVLIPFIERAAQPTPALEEPQLGFDVVGNFEPSYTEYVTEYVLAEVWLPGAEGYIVHVTKGAHGHQTIKGEKAKT